MSFSPAPRDPTATATHALINVCIVQLVMTSQSWNRRTRSIQPHIKAVHLRAHTHTPIILCMAEKLNQFSSSIINNRQTALRLLTHENEMCAFYHIPGVTASKTSIAPRPSCFTSQCSGSTPGPAVVMRGQRDRQPGFTHGAGGRGQARKGKRIGRPEMHTKKASITNSIARILCQSHHS